MPSNNQVMNVDANAGNTQIVQHSDNTTQNNYYGNDFWKNAITEQKPETVVILGAGVDAMLGMPSSASLLPNIVDYLNSDEGKAVEIALRKILKRVTFRFDKFVDDTIGRLTKDLDKEIHNIRNNIHEELKSNDKLSDNERKMGELIVLLFQKIINIKAGAQLDETLEPLITELLDIDVKDDTIIDFSRISYTETFSLIIKRILNESIHNSDHPVLRHVYKNMLDIEQLLSKYFYGFYVGKESAIKTYMYISWVMWAFLVSEEKRITEQQGENFNRFPLYSQLSDERCQVISFNYTTFAQHFAPSAIYFHGILTDYVDVENKADKTTGKVSGIDVVDFFTTVLPIEINVDNEGKAYPIPTFLPPLKLKPVISNNYINIWYKTANAIVYAKKLIILGCSFATPDDFFADMLRASNAEIIIVDKNPEDIVNNVCRIFQFDKNRSSNMFIDGKKAVKYNNRITIVEADLKDVIIEKL